MAQGDHIPTAPPVPEEILKALEQNARDEAAGIFDDGMFLHLLIFSIIELQVLILTITGNAELCWCRVRYD